MEHHIKYIFYWFVVSWIRPKWLINVIRLRLMGWKLWKINRKCLMAASFIGHCRQETGHLPKIIIILTFSIARCLSVDFTKLYSIYQALNWVGDDALKNVYKFLWPSRVFKWKITGIFIKIQILIKYYTHFSFWNIKN